MRGTRWNFTTTHRSPSRTVVLYAPLSFSARVTVTGSGLVRLLQRLNEDEIHHKVHLEFLEDDNSWGLRATLHKVREYENMGELTYRDQRNLAACVDLKQNYGEGFIPKFVEDKTFEEANVIRQRAWEMLTPEQKGLHGASNKRWVKQQELLERGQYHLLDDHLK